MVGTAGCCVLGAAAAQPPVVSRSYAFLTLRPSFLRILELWVVQGVLDCEKALVRGSSLLFLAQSSSPLRKTESLASRFIAAQALGLGRSRYFIDISLRTVRSSECVSLFGVRKVGLIGRQNVGP